MYKLCKMLGRPTATEAEELAGLEKNNMTTIENVYKRLKDDIEIQAHIRQIKVHPWLQVVKGQ
ncbi:MAG: hypothetical protein SCH39_13685 [Methanosarcinales archaeon]|nr:hypothetical protein [Methanosarcinales archaeon]